MYLSKTGSKGKRILINVVLGILSLVWIFPIVFLIIGSMKTKTEYNMTNFWQLAQRINWKENFEYIVKYSQIFHSVLNSLLYSLFGTVGAIILAVLAAYGLTKLSIKHKMFWFMIIYSGTIFPFQMYLIPVFKAYMKLNLYDTQIGLVVFYIAICIPFSMFVFRNQWREQI
jgi:multiple sugar transport system permease protein